MKVLEPSLTERIGRDFMQDRESVFGRVEAVVYEMLVPDGRVGGGQHSEPDRQHVHVQEGYVGPVVECWA